jgi:Zn-dependent protease
LVYLDEGYLLWMVVGSAVMHELGHYIPLKIFGGKVLLLELSGGGLTMEHDAREKLGYGKELASVVMGPILSIGFALLFSLLNDMMLWQIAGICLTHGIFNLLPMSGLDGGRALEIILAMRGSAAPQSAVRVTTAVCGAILGGFCVLLAVLYHNPSLLLALLYLLALRKRKAVTA